jgi:hypothetical protein
MDITELGDRRVFWGFDASLPRRLFDGENKKCDVNVGFLTEPARRLKRVDG